MADNLLPVTLIGVCWRENLKLCMRKVSEGFANIHRKVLLKNSEIEAALELCIVKD